MDRRTFSHLLPALLAATATFKPADAQQALPSASSPTVPPAGHTSRANLPDLISGVYPPGAASGSPPARVSHRYLAGILKAGDIQLEIHETRQDVGTPHEPVGTHLHSEIWLVREGVCELTTNGITRRMQAGDVGLCVAGDLHYVRNAGDTPCSYFVVTVGPPEHKP